MRPYLVFNVWWSLKCDDFEEKKPPRFAQCMFSNFEVRERGFMLTMWNGENF